MLKSGDVIKHKSFKDVACIVHGINQDNTILVEWINQGFIKSWSLLEYSVLPKVDSDWYVCMTLSPVCYRHAVWRQL